MTTARNHRRFGFRIAPGVVALLLGLAACGGEKKEEKVSGPAAPGVPAPPVQEAAISGTITLDPALKDRVGSEPLLMIMASKFPDPNKPPIVVKRVASVTFPYDYKLTAEDITLVGSSFDGRMYVTARIDPAGMVGAARPGTFEGSYPGNPVGVGSTKVDVLINKAY